MNDLFLKLCENYTTSHIFLTETPDGDLWIGATPETLLEKKEGGYETMSLAGTKESADESLTQSEKLLHDISKVFDAADYTITPIFNTS